MPTQCSILHLLEVFIIMTYPRVSKYFNFLLNAYYYFIFLQRGYYENIGRLQQDEANSNECSNYIKKRQEHNPVVLSTDLP